MKVLESQTGVDSLAAFGAAAAALLRNRQFRSLADRFGYARAFDREPAQALAADLASVLADIPGATGLVRVQEPIVKYFEPNDTGLFALVECPIRTNASSSVLLELVVSGPGPVRWVGVEDISVRPPPAVAV